MRKVWAAGVVAGMALSMTMQVFAGSWQQDMGRPVNENGISNWRYQNDDGTYSAGCWAWMTEIRTGLQRATGLMRMAGCMLPRMWMGMM